MSLSWPWALIALVAFPLLLAYRWWTRRRRRRGAVRVSSVALIRAALPGQSSWRRRIPIWLFAAGLVILSVGAARPQAKVPVPANSSAIVLAVDVSGSMCSTDVPPNRLTAAQKAARDFINAQHDGSSIGLVAFSGIAAVLVPPTTDKHKLLDAIGTFRTSRGTAIGLAILASIDAIASVNPDVPPTGVTVPATTSDAPTADYEPDTIVVLTDGANTQGVDPTTAARQAAARRIRIYTIGFGTTQPSPMVCSPDQIGAGGGFGGGGFGGGGFGGGFGGQRGFGGGGRGYQELGEDTLNQVAKTTGGKYFVAQDADQLASALNHLPNTIVVQRKNVEITVWFALAGALLILLAVGLSQWWSRFTRPPPTPRPAPTPVPAGRS